MNNSHTSDSFAPLNLGRDGASGLPRADDQLLAAIEGACTKACGHIAPAWPLDRSIAVNPHWGRIGYSVRTVAARMALLGGARVFPDRRYIREAWEEGRITSDDLRAALRSCGELAPTRESETEAIAALELQPSVQQLPLLIDLLNDTDGRERRLPWRDAITHQVSQVCAAYFDTHQADWSPREKGSLYAFWRDTLQHDQGIGILMNVPSLKKHLIALPRTPQLAEQWVIKELGLPEAVWADYLEAVLLTVNGWASWCRYLGWQAEQEGRQDTTLRELLAIRLAWGVILLRCVDASTTARALRRLRMSWGSFASRLAHAADEFRKDEVWQVALERGYQRTLENRLRERQSSAARVAPSRITAQAAFCIDVRSEPMRRAIEAVDPSVQTKGFAGFFGLPIAYAPLGTDARRPQLPGLLAPAIDVAEVMQCGVRGHQQPIDVGEVTEARRMRFLLEDQWHHASRWPGAAFSYVESFGVTYGASLLRWLCGGEEERPRDDLGGLGDAARHCCRPALDHVALETRVSIAAKVLHAMGLCADFAPLVLLVGHGSQSTNNPLSSALDCGACCGQTGEVNARVLARLLNAPEVRKGMAAQGVEIPDTTWFVAALHNTTTDEVTCFDTDLLPEHGEHLVASIAQTFARAADRVRMERAPRLGIQGTMETESLLKTLQHRASDGAQTRPEWGLAGNAAFIIAPRAATMGLDLGGRTFLHDYEEEHDADGSILELLMTAPMVVTNWINWQYHASTCEPLYYGSGNKILHNVVGGNIGVFEGNGGDLRIGLSQQSLHNGKKWMHEPVRLTVGIQASQDRIEMVLAKHETVRMLVQHGWLYLWRLTDGTIERYVEGVWLSF